MPGDASDSEVAVKIMTSSNIAQKVVQNHDFISNKQEHIQQDDETITHSVSYITQNT